MSTVRTRFAPSPTGHLHIGGARTALFCWLYARRHGGKFILRIDDTDRERSTKEMELAILEGMKWLGLDWDEGPFYQSQRSELYEEAIRRLLEAGHLYRCVCTPEELEAKRKAALAKNENPRYDGTCRNRTDISPDQPHVLRFKSPTVGETIIDDGIQGKVIFPNSELDDLVIRRTDGTPTYNFSSVVDDVDMGITHIIRGADHLNNTPRQYQIFNALGAETPIFAHMPLTLGPDKTKLSKRHGDTALLAYRDKGFLPEAMLNYMVRLGWSHGDDEIFTVDELKKLFDFDGCTNSPGIFDIAKLTWVNEKHMQIVDNQTHAKRLPAFLEKIRISVSENKLSLERIVALLKTRNATYVEMAEKAERFFNGPQHYERLTKNHINILNYLRLLIKTLSPTFSKSDAMQIMQDVMSSFNLKLDTVAQALRIAIWGENQSPEIDEVISILGKDETITRIDRAVRYMKWVSVEYSRYRIWLIDYHPVGRYPTCITFDPSEIKHNFIEKLDPIKRQMIENDTISEPFSFGLLNSEIWQTYKNSARLGPNQLKDELLKVYKKRTKKRTSFQVVEIWMDLQELVNKMP